MQRLQFIQGAIEMLCFSICFDPSVQMDEIQYSFEENQFKLKFLKASHPKWQEVADFIHSTCSTIPDITDTGTPLSTEPTRSIYIPLQALQGLDDETFAKIMSALVMSYDERANTLPEKAATPTLQHEEPKQLAKERMDLIMADIVEVIRTIFNKRSPVCTGLYISDKVIDSHTKETLSATIVFERGNNKKCQQFAGLIASHLGNIAEQLHASEFCPKQLNKEDLTLAPSLKMTHNPYSEPGIKINYTALKEISADEFQATRERLRALAELKPATRTRKINEFDMANHLHLLAGLPKPPKNHGR